MYGYSLISLYSLGTL